MSCEEREQQVSLWWFTYTALNGNKTEPMVTFWSLEKRAAGSVAASTRTERVVRTEVAVIRKWRQTEGGRRRGADL